MVLPGRVHLYTLLAPEDLPGRVHLYPPLVPVDLPDRVHLYRPLVPVDHAPPGLPALSIQTRGHYR
ncbi:hypothetical protein VEE27_20420 [Escherichia coli]|nr:hypothetical protein VEE27_20420 [Escherichia coli]